MTYRVFMTVGRGPMDKTAVCVFPWERELLEEIHGGGAEHKTIEELTTFKGVVSAKKLKLPIPGTGALPAGDLKSQLRAMTIVPAEDDPAHDLSAEFVRLQEKYGMHPSVNMTVVEKVYGNAGNFSRAVRKYTGKKPPRGEEAEHDPRNDEIDESSIAGMNGKELKAELRKREIPFDTNAKLDELRDLLKTVTA